MKYCSDCAAPLTVRTPEGDERPRHCCNSCGTIHYQNPKNVVGTLPVYGNQILLCKRAISPRSGKWTLPAGFMENGESSLAGAIRETKEEAGALVIGEEASLYMLFNLPRINQMYIFFKVELANLEFSPGIESEDVALFYESEIPWDEIAFPVVKTTLKQYFEDFKYDKFPVRMFDVHYGQDRKVSTEMITCSNA